MSRSSLFLATSCFALVACQPAADAPQELVAETPPPIEETAEVETPAETEAAVEEIAADVSAEAAPVDAAAEPETATEAETHDHDHEDEHDHGDEEAHDHGDEHDHDHDAEEAHDHGDDHDHDHAGGEAHVHGLSDLAASLDGSTLSISVEGALANFDLDETIRTLDETATYADGTVEIVGGDCVQTTNDVSIRPIGDHGNLMIDLTYTCGSPGDIEGINVTGFQTYQGFETVNAVYLTESGQTAETLTESDTRLDLN